MFCRAMVKLSFINKKQKVKVNKRKKKKFCKSAHNLFGKLFKTKIYNVFNEKIDLNFCIFTIKYPKNILLKKICLQKKREIRLAKLNC